MPETEPSNRQLPDGMFARLRASRLAFLARDLPPAEMPAAPPKADAAAPLESCEGSEHHHAALLLDAWKKMVDVQQHFNDIELRIRHFAVTVFAATFAALAYALEHPQELTLLGYKTPLTTGVLVVSLTSWLAFYFMDRWWYHQLLKGSVLEAIDLEKQLQQHFRNINLTTRIGERSPIKYGYSTLVLSVAVLMLVISQQHDAFARGLFGFALIVALQTYHRYRRIWPRGERFNLLRRFGFNDIVMLGGMITSCLLYANNIQAAIALLALGMFILTNRMARHRNNWRLRSSQKVDLFYSVGFIVLASVGSMLHVAPPSKMPEPPSQESRSGSAVVPASAPQTASPPSAPSTGASTTLPRISDAKSGSSGDPTDN